MNQDDAMSEESTSSSYQRHMSLTTLVSNEESINDESSVEVMDGLATQKIKSSGNKGNYGDLGLKFPPNRIELHNRMTAKTN